MLDFITSASRADLELPRVIQGRHCLATSSQRTGPCLAWLQPEKTTNARLHVLSKITLPNFQFSTKKLQVINMAESVPQIQTETVCTRRAERLAAPLQIPLRPMAEVLGTFGAPTTAECTLIRGKILQVATHISQLDNEIERPENAQLLGKLCLNHAALRIHRAGYQNLLSSTRRLPVEILGGIFLHYQGMSPSGRSIAPTQVCRHWRDTALATSGLWNHFKIRYQEPSELDTGTVNVAEMTRIWLRRSSGQPLKLEFEPCAKSSGECGKNADIELFALIKDQAHRWQDVKLTITESVLSMIASMPSNLPMLQSLHLNGPEYGQQLSSFDAFKHTPALRTIKLGRRISSLLPDFPWSQLTSCDLMGGGCYTAQDAYKVLSEAINLEIFSATVFPPVDETPVAFKAFPPIQHDKISCLKIASATTSMQDLINALTLPALVEFSVFERYSSSAAEFLTSLIVRSRCSLKHLVFMNAIWLSRQDLLDIFTLVPMVSKLELHDSNAAGLVESMINLLTHRSNHAEGSCCLLPHLTSIRIPLCVSGFSYEKLVEFLSSRCHPAACGAKEAPLAQLRKVELMLLRPSHGGRVQVLSNTLNALRALHGRRPVYLYSLPFLCLGSIGVALAQNVPSLMILRFIQAFGASAGLSVGSGAIGDVYKLEERGTAMGIFFGAILLGPALAPLCGGLAAAYASWRVMQDKSPRHAWDRQVARVDWGEGRDRRDAEAERDSVGEPARKLVVIAQPKFIRCEYGRDACTAYKLREIKGLTCSLIAVLLVPMAYTIGARYNITNEAMIGACFLPAGLGNIVGAPLAGRLSDRIVTRYRARRKGQWVPEDRLRATLLGAALFVPVSVLSSGLITHYVEGRLGLGLNLVCLFFNGLGADFVLSPSASYAVDVVHSRSAESMAANT
ncbi:hypothetical protein HWV62_35498 [Athelia sp. TMB]|nr:hypothetical protein HWV62_35498 [Athelia sp. TMB]